ncbi:hypothetical protein HC928_06515 [bacterium]|nr:hypothetical protein [bacterium]
MRRNENNQVLPQHPHHLPLDTNAHNTAQNSTPEPIDTPEHTKTPNASTDQAADEQAQGTFETFTQSDLNVLTGNVQRPNATIWFNDNIYAVCNGDWTIYELNDTNGDTRTFIYGVRNAHSMYIEATSETDFTMWIPDYDVNALLSVDRTQAPRQIITGLEGPWGISYINENSFLITNLLGGNIVHVTRSGEVRLVLDELRSPTGIASDEEFVYFANNGSARRSIEWVNLADILEEQTTPQVQPLVSGLQNTTSVLLANDGYLYFSYAVGTRGVVGRVDPTICREQETGCTNDQVEVILYTDLAAPLAGLTISPDMRLFVHTIFRPEIYWVQLPGE